jgi:predicted secreted protein
MQPVPTGTGRSARLVLVAVGLLVLLAVVAFATRSGLGHSSQAKPTPGYVSYAFTAFLIVFVLAIPVALWSFFVQAREGQIQRKKFHTRVIENVAMMLFFGVIAFVIIYMKQHHHQLLRVHTIKPAHGKAPKHHANGKAAPYEPHFEYSVLWIALVALVVGGGFIVYRWRTRKKRPLVPLNLQPTVAEDFASSIDDAIDDLEAEADARRAVIAAYARMEGVLSRHGLRRRPSDTPVEYLRRVLLGLTSQDDAVQRLTRLFEEAKFSRHEIDASMKQEAITALRTIREDLQS